LKNKNIKVFEAAPKQGAELKVIAYDSKVPPKGKAVVVKKTKNQSE
jgi:hypothetical protein